MKLPDNYQPKSNRPHEEEIIALLSSIQPVPRQQFHQRMQKAPWINVKNQYSFRAFQKLHTFPRSAIAFVFVIVILIAIVFTPALVSNARQIFRFFWVHEDTTRSISITQTSTLPSITHLTEYPFPLSIEEATQMVEFPIKIPSRLPKGTSLEGAAFDETRQAVVLKYAGDGKSVLVTQREAESISEYASVGSNATAEITMVRGVQGELITGGWVVQSSGESQPGSVTQTINLIWENQAGMWTLRWEENDIVYEIVVASSQNISLNEILAIAESMR